MTAKTLLTVFLLAGALLPRIHAATIVVVDLNRVFEEYHRTRQMEQQFQARVQEFQAERERKQQEFQEKQQAFQRLRQESAQQELDEPTRQTLAEQAAAMLNDLQQSEQNIRQEIQNSQQQLEAQGLRMRRRILDEIQEKVNEMAAERNWDLVLDRAAISGNGTPVVLHAATTLDVSNEILQSLNRAFETELQAQEEAAE